MLCELKKYADRRSLAMGRAVSELVRRGLSAPVQTKVVNGIHVVIPAKNSTPVDTEHVQRLLGDSRQ